jgi:hypothetical protein
LSLVITRAMLMPNSPDGVSEDFFGFEKSDAFRNRSIVTIR